MTAPDWKIQEGAQVMCITGMHRSGTSMFTRIANLMGVSLSDRLVPPLPNNNATGFWEHAPLVDLHEELLERYSSWHLGLTDLPADHLTLSTTKVAQQKIWGLLRRDFAHEACWGVKDPRISRLVPLWKETLGKLGAAPVWVICVRHPGEVAASLVKRNRISRERALLLWLKYNLEAEFHTRGEHRVFLHYPDVLADWKGACRRVARLAGFQWPRSVEEAEKEVTSFLDPHLRHQQESGTANLPAWMARAYHALAEAARSNGGEVDTTTLDAVRADFESFHAPLQEDITELREINDQQARDIEALKRHLELLFGSVSWRLTTPVRAAKRGAKWLIGRPEISA